MLAFIHSLQLLHSFRPHPSSLQTYSVPVHFSPTWNLNGAVSLGRFPPWPQISICPFPPLFSFPMAVFYFRRKLMKIIETCTTKRNLIFFNIWWRASPPPQRKGSHVKDTSSPLWHSCSAQSQLGSRLRQICISLNVTLEKSRSC